MGRRYAREGLRKLRQLQVDEQRTRLAHARAAAVGAGAELIKASSDRRDLELGHRATEAGEYERLTRRTASVAEFAAVDAWRCAVRDALEVLQSSERRAKHAAASAQERETGERRRLGDAVASANTLELDREEWLEEQRLRAEHSAESERAEHLAASGVTQGRGRT